MTSDFAGSLMKLNGQHRHSHSHSHRHIHTHKHKQAAEMYRERERAKNTCTTYTSAAVDYRGVQVNVARV